MKKAQIILALDVPTPAEIAPVVDSLPAINFYKVGLELFTAGGPSSLDYLRKKNKNIFLDLKLHDIPRTVERAVKAAAKYGINILTVHAGGGRAMLKAAAEAAMESRTLKIVAVTALTSLGQEDLKELGIERQISTHIFKLGELALGQGIHGLVCSPLEAAAFRNEFGPDPILITPGIRPAGSDKGDQKRIATPEIAVKAGADYLVIGRPIMDAPDRHKASLSIIDEIEKAAL